MFSYHYESIIFNDVGGGIRQNHCVIAVAELAKQEEGRVSDGWDNKPTLSSGTDA